MLRHFSALTVCCVFLVLLVSFAAISLGAYTVGVKTGNWIRYSGIAVGSGGIEGFGDLNETSWIEGKVATVSDTSVTMQLAAHFKNNSETNMGKLTGDVATGSGNLSLILLPAGLKKGDVIPSWVVDVPGLTFNDTVTRPYAGVNRTTNVLNLSLPHEIFSVTIVAFWDQATGILVEIATSSMVPGQSFQFNMKATETNMWSIGGLADIGAFLLDNLIYIVGLIVVIVVIIALTAVMMRRRKPAPAPAAQATTPAAEQKPA